MPVQPSEMGFCEVLHRVKPEGTATGIGPDSENFK